MKIAVLTSFVLSGEEQRKLFLKYLSEFPFPVSEVTTIPLSQLNKKVKK